MDCLGGGRVYVLATGCDRQGLFGIGVACLGLWMAVFQGTLQGELFLLNSRRVRLRLNSTSLFSFVATSIKLSQGKENFSAEKLGRVLKLHNTEQLGSYSPLSYLRSNVSNL